MELIIFDMDGTLFRTELRKESLWEKPTPINEYLAILGAPMEKVWNALLPDHSVKVKEKADHLFWGYLVEEINLENGELYTKVKKTLLP
jgi:phosphoglycolate phosphatase-like HAD superfamily hydrolase